MKWKTKISFDKDGEHYIRGKSLIGLIEKYSFVWALFLVILGQEPSDKEEKLMNAILVSAIDHGISTPSAYVPRIVISSGNDVNAAIASGALAVGERHGGAIEKAMRMFKNEKDASSVVSEALSKNEILPGFGHKIYKEKDPRAQALLKKAKDLGFDLIFADKAVKIEEEIRKQKGKKLPLNIDGAIAVLLCEMGFDSKTGKAFFILARMPSMIANIIEEMNEEKTYRRLNEEDVEYGG
ncbi:MAG: hypothetical protein A2931_03720 [Candidatus Niyogibacteria bacterium RIFCSPLOWO2_01_FULL_45_48]|uniref:citrate synthase (unknown stereospecificity) n=2 Tax=Candidatus Niyogiibacteriota TaxID=1817912 RepID=A0A1G2EXW8_9BACT|nr:MAG: hypothetical protein A2835_03820 [Candidatus Niyogibacteria bacterium RIFCSPHIGHO2_01_FULL_45_28]OGZ30191.1 MAG: hypothetical protein A3J00_00795 [Candidatus Niyogibacteria bacterium RIFCSPLOWO2_02_FULL_45_13]OGZ30937.1 MAG: hypothetical protein A2931_03720 [Candidatus Niyogibacteria bacterium RIFCSPLOWO2_01_FULL_45_48]